MALRLNFERLLLPKLQPLDCLQAIAQCKVVVRIEFCSYSITLVRVPVGFRETCGQARSVDISTLFAITNRLLPIAVVLSAVGLARQKR